MRSLFLKRMLQKHLDQFAMQREQYIQNKVLLEE